MTNYFSPEMIGYCVVVLLVLVAACYLIYIGKLSLVKKIVYSVVIEADKKFGEEQDDIKYAYIVGAVYPRLPIIARQFITKKYLGELIQEGMDELKKFFEENPEQVAKFYNTIGKDFKPPSLESGVENQDNQK